MNQQDLTIITANIQGQLNNKLIAPICLAGIPGTGKSTQIQLLAKQLDMNLVVQSAPCLTVESLSGLPAEYLAPEYQPFAINGVSPYATSWSIPELIVATLKAASEKATILLLDDFHMVPPHLQAYFYSLLLERRLGNYRLADNVAIVLTMNESELAGFSGMPSPVRNRLSILSIEFNFDYWMNTFGYQLHYLVASFLRAKPHYCIEPETTSVEGFASARAWTAIAAELTLHTEQFLETNAKRIVGMQVSQNAANAFQSHVAYVTKINFGQLVEKQTPIFLAKQDSLDSIIYAYITNFIKTVDDGLYLFHLLTLNKDQSIFIGFVFGELYTRYVNLSTKNPLSDGLRFVLDKLLGLPLDSAKYTNTSKVKLTKAFATEITDKEHFMSVAQEYLL